MEEDIKLLEEMKANCIKGMMKGAIYTDEKAERKALAIDNIIKGYREKEESEKYLYDAYQDAGKKMFEYAEQLKDSVPKSKIKEKIEEYKKKIIEAREEDDDCKELYYEQEIKVLQELLGDE